MPSYTESSPVELKRVKSIQFSVLNPNEIKSMSVAEINLPATYEENSPVPHGLLDLRLGTTDNGQLCQSCFSDRTECPGHFGHIELARPVFHIGFLSVLLKTLRCVCFKCSRLLVNRRSLQFKKVAEMENPKERFSAIYNLCKGNLHCGFTNTKDGKVIDGCNNKQPTYRRENIHINVEYPESYISEKWMDRKRRLPARDVFNVFSKISDQDCHLLGFHPKFSRPEWLVVTVLAVPPPSVRPAVQFNSIAYSMDDLTHKLGDIIRANNNIKESERKGTPEQILIELEELLQYNVATLIDNEIPGLPQSKQRGGKPLKSLRQRLVGKAGRVRGNLMGKRVDFSARTVISGDPSISIEELGIPISIAMNLTIPERVTRFNINEMRTLVKNGSNVHPGAKNIIRNDQRIISLKYLKRVNDEHVQLGYIIERHLRDGDIVLFNRQPTLHKMSFMAHRIKILPYSTFRLNLSVTTPYNADFDGDEMNLHVPQTLQSRAEAKELMLVSKNIVSPQGNKPIIGIVQDSLLGVMKFTRRDCFLGKHLAFNLLMWADSWDGEVPSPAILKPQPLWTGKQILSIILPEVNYTKFSSNHDEKEHFSSPCDTRVLIHSGDLLMGILDKKTLGRSFGSLIHVLWNEFGHVVCRNFIDELQLIVTYWLEQEGASIGISDTIADAATLLDINSTIVTAKKEVTGIINRARSHELNRLPGQTIMESFETNVNNALNSATENAGKCVQKALSEHNNIKQMVDAGSKGNLINICQIIACVGQQNVQGKRIPFGFVNRTLPHFNKDDLGPESRGFVENSYLQGLTPQEMFFHAMGGREGLVDTAVKTAETGYIQRRLVKAMEHLSIRYDGTVRTANEEIVQFIYGEDGIDGAHIEQQRIESVWLSKKRFEERFVWSSDELLREIHPNLLEKIGKTSEDDELLDSEVQQLRDDAAFYRTHIAPLMDFNQNIYLPVNIERLMANCQRIFSISPYTQSELDPREIIERVRKLCDELVVIKGNDSLHLEAQENATLLFKMHVRSCLSSKTIIIRRRLTLPAFEYLVTQIKYRFQNSFAQPGEMIGALAAQSIGEPATQMTLNTFHYAGVSAKNVTLGVPRLRELINVASKIRTASLTIYLQPEIAQDSSKATDLLNCLEYTLLRDITLQTEIYYDPNPSSTLIDEDREFLQAYDDLAQFDGETGDDTENFSNWVLRIILDKKKKQTKGITNQEIAGRINKDFAGDIHCVFNSDNADTPILRIRLINPQPTADEEDQNVEDFINAQDDAFLRKIEENLLGKMALRGVEGITKVFMQKLSRKEFDSDTNQLREDRQEWVLDTEGVNLRQVSALPEVDFTRTISNDIREMCAMYGIEAARNALLNEIRNVISFDGSYVNARHITTLVDCMTNRGYLMSITRHGLNRISTGPLMRCSFEETAEILHDAAVFAEKDSLEGVSESLMLGNLPPVGTGSIDLFLDVTKLGQAQTTLDDENDLEYDLHGMSGENALDAFSSSKLTPSYEMATPQMSPLLKGKFSPLKGSFSPSAAISTPVVSSNLADIASSPTDSFGSSIGSSSPFSSPTFSPTSPTYSPTSPNYSPTSPMYSATSPAYSPNSPNYNPTSPTYKPTSPSYTNTSPNYSPTSPNYKPTSPSYSPTSPSYSPASPSYSPTSPSYSPASPSYSPTSPAYMANTPAVYNTPATSTSYSPAVEEDAFADASPSDDSAFSSPLRQIDDDAFDSDLENASSSPSSNKNSNK